METITATIGPLHLSIHYDRWRNQWGMWKNSVNPYRSVDNFKNPDAEIIMNPEESRKPELLRMFEQRNKTFVWEKQTGFFRQTVERTDAGNQIICLRKKETVFLRVGVTADWKQVYLLEDNTGSAGDAAFEFLSTVVPGICLNHGMLSIHGVLMEHKERGLIISAPSGTGKTTHARLWREFKDAVIINGDRSTCVCGADGWTGIGIPWSGSSGEQINRHVKITALVILERGDENCVEYLEKQDAFRALFPNLLYPAWDGLLVGKAMDAADVFLGLVPVLRLKCCPEREAVEVLDRALCALDEAETGQELWKRQ